MKNILSILGFLSFTLVLQAQTENPPKDIQVQQKFATQIGQCYFVNGDYWQLEQLCNENADSIYSPMLTWARGMAAARLFQLEEAKMQLGKYVYEYQYKMPEEWMLNAANELSLCLSWLQEYEEAAKVADIALQYISEEGIADEHQGAILRFTEIRDRNLEFSKYPKMTLSCNEHDIKIPFQIKTLGKGKGKNKLMTIDGSMHSLTRNVSPSSPSAIGSAQVQGKPVSMVFDTGCGQNVISKKMAEELHLKPINTGAIIEGSGQSDATYVIADSLTMGNVTFSNVIFAMIDTNNDDVSQITSILIGVPVMLQMRQFAIDFKQKVITSPSQLTEYPSKNIAFDTEGGNFNVRLYHEGKPIDMKVDTGNGHYSHLDYQYYTENQENLDRCKELCLPNVGLGGVYEKKYALLKKFDFILNDKSYRFPFLTVMKDKMEAALGGNNMGLPFISSFKRVTISLKDAYIEFE